MLTAGDVEQASARVALYQIRRRSSVPISVLTSVTLARQLKNPSPDTFTQRLSLSMAITRFVNGLTDRFQPRGQGASARSVHTLAVGLGLPLILVDIRHQSCHNLLPRLTALESGAKQALVWLEQHYWEPQHRSIALQLPEEYRELKEVIESDASLDVEKAGLWFQTASERSSDSANDSTAILLSKMKEAAERLEEKQRKATTEPRIISKRPRPGTKRWRRCTNSEAWKTVPLGLIPGQERPPRLKVHKPNSGFRAHTTKTTGTSLVQENGELETPDMPAIESMGEKPVQSHVRRLTEEDDERVTHFVNHFRGLISA